MQSSALLQSAVVQAAVQHTLAAVHGAVQPTVQAQNGVVHTGRGVQCRGSADSADHPLFRLKGSLSDADFECLFAGAGLLQGPETRLQRQRTALKSR